MSRPQEIMIDGSMIIALLRSDDAVLERAFVLVRPHVRIRDGGSPRIMWERGLRWSGRRRAFHIGDEPWDRIARSMLV
jgi:hypothetical protein